MNDLPELVAIPNLILAALRNPYGFTEADLRFARLHAADQIEAARRAIRRNWCGAMGASVATMPICTPVSRNRRSIRWTWLASQSELSREERAVRSGQPGSCLIRMSGLSSSPKSTWLGESVT